MKDPNESCRAVREALKDDLTFYHELRTPKHPFFDPAANQAYDNDLLVVSSPSRMGNHLLMSVLDDHPELPRLPGEDGFLMFTFAQANRDLGHLLRGFRSAECVEFVMRLATNGDESKWKRFRKCFENRNTAGAKVAGVGVGSYSALLDFEDTVFEIDYESYRSVLEAGRRLLANATCYREVLHLYLHALSRLDPTADRRTSAFESYLVYGGMRTQLKWLCETHPRVKILSSIRSFPSYAVSQIKSRHGDVALTGERLQTAWEHWFHKVIDALYLAVHYPGQVGLVSFEDLLESPRETHEAICRFLGVAYAESMNRATIFGHPVKGNSWSSRREHAGGDFYRPNESLTTEHVPEKAALIWEQVRRLKLC